MHTERVVVRVSGKETKKRSAGEGKRTKDDEGMGYNGRKEFVSREKSSLSASGNFFPAEWKSREEGRARIWIRSWRESLENIYQMHVYIINNLFGKCEIREVEKYDVSGLFEDWMSIGVYLYVFCLSCLNFERFLLIFFIFFFLSIVSGSTSRWPARRPEWTAKRFG